jgi:hypothetical protein
MSEGLAQTGATRSGAGNFGVFNTPHPFSAALYGDIRVLVLEILLKG